MAKMEEGMAKMEEGMAKMEEGMAKMESGTVPVQLVVQRFEGNPEDMERDRTRHVYPGAKWVARGESHFVTVEESLSKDEASSSAAGSTRTVYRIEPHKLTINRFGAVEWHHRFVPGEVASSILSVKGAGDMEVTTETSSLYVKLGERTGELQVQYIMNMGGVRQEVEIRLEYQPASAE